MTLEFTLNRDNPATASTGCIVVGVFADKSLSPAAQALDQAAGGRLAQLAASKGCVYLDLWEALADGEGNLKEMIAAPDGVHLSAGNGYGAWVTYLRNHAKYSADNAWTPGSAYAG